MNANVAWLVDLTLDFASMNRLQHSRGQMHLHLPLTMLSSTSSGQHQLLATTSTDTT